MVDLSKDLLLLVKFLVDLGKNLPRLGKSCLDLGQVLVRTCLGQVLAQELQLGGGGGGGGGSSRIKAGMIRQSSASRKSKREWSVQEFMKQRLQRAEIIL